ncbi:hypothetical protein EJ05DRAFT_278260 [Pseudovirgaria hyperparasitica]|uniref:SET domain-containing protein n=1 Tax=Pseudovirgaria hyperparasitica TaxID=470096 RepID=A0A6A6WE52_9PEZI|nr:uncharacterized protein EJ05DRAFT_278260 [Pseudovirgaria hyperparasitica]KAF2760270.1 hypothetical protein EJ05DRAFT_278260 [Pseudovirgaria hyperparasitica]
MSPQFVSPEGSASPVSQGSSISKPTKFDVSHILRVEILPGDFASRAVSKVTLPAGALFTPIKGITPATPSYLTVQTGPTSHISLNSDLQYINHSCRPTVEFDMAKNEIRVARDLKGGLKEGDELSFFYPSSEWNMDQPFQCRCKDVQCLGSIQGAKYLGENDMKRFWFNDHILKMKERGC